MYACITMLLVVLHYFRYISVFLFNLDMSDYNKGSLNNGQGASTGYSQEGFIYRLLDEATNLGSPVLEKRC